MAQKKKLTTINSLRDSASAKLSRANINLREVDTMLAYVLGVTEAYCMSHPEEIVSKKDAKKFEALVKKRIKRVPMAYLLKSKGFFGLDFYVDERVIIPRPETEVLVEWVLKHIDRELSLTIVDVGTGSGCIAVTLAKYMPKAKIFASDISAKALTVAKKNAASHKVKSKITYKKGSLLQPHASTKIDVVVSNLPYLEKHELSNVPFEPIEALYGGNKGLEKIDELITQIIERDIKKAILEIHPLQEGWLDMRLRNIDTYHHYFLKDNANKTRALVIEKAREPVTVPRA